MQQLIIMLHVLVSVSLIALVLLQHGKGSDMGAGFGAGASNTMFGSAGSTPFLMKVTGVLAAIFFLTSLWLSFVVSERVRSTQHTSMPAPMQQSVPVPTGTPDN